MERINLILNNKKFIAVLNSIEYMEKDRLFCRHGLQHLLDTSRIAYIISLERGLRIKKDVIYAAALLHDAGRCRGSENHNSQGGDIAEGILKNCGYAEDEINMICDAIKSHGRNSGNLSDLAEVLSSADHLSRQCFSCKAFDDCYWQDDKKNKCLKY